MIWLYCIIIPTLYFTCILFPQSKDHKNKTQNTTVIWAKRAIQGYNMRVWISNQMTLGLQAWDVQSGDQIPVEPHFGMEYPANSGVEHIYSVGPEIGGIKNGVKFVIQGHESFLNRRKFLPNRYGQIWQTSTLYNGTTPNKRYYDDDNDGLVDEDDLDGNDNDGDWDPLTDDVGSDGLADPFEVSCDGVPYDSIANPDPAQDNYDPSSYDKCHLNPDNSKPLKNNRDRWTEHNGLPDHGEPNVDEDYGAVSHNDLYCSATDTITGFIPPSSSPVGIKLIQKSYAWDIKSYEAILPFDYYFINISRDTIKDVYIGFFADMDVGPVNAPHYLENNYAGYIPEFRTGYVHNPVDIGSTPAGLTILGTTKPLDSLRFFFYWSGLTIIDTLGDSQLYNMMSGISLSEDIESDQSIKNLNDTRFRLSFGPFKEFKQFDTIKVSFALVSGYGINEGTNSLRENVSKAIIFYNRGYNPPPVPLSPKLEAKAKYKRAEIKWYPNCAAVQSDKLPWEIWDDSNKLAEAYPDTHWRRVDPPCYGNLCTRPGGRIFKGFRLYRSESQNIEPEPNSFYLLREYLISDTSRPPFYDIDTTYIDSNLTWGKRYWYSVTSIGLPDISINSVSEAGGLIRYDTIYSDYSESNLRENWIKVDAEFPPSEMVGEVLVVPNPYKTDQNYTYEFGGWEGFGSTWDESKRSIKFIHLPKGEWTLRIFTLMGEKVTVIKNTIENGYEQGGKRLENYREERGEINFFLINESGMALASGVYIYIIDSDFGQQTGKFVIIK